MSFQIFSKKIVGTVFVISISALSIAAQMTKSTKPAPTPEPTPTFVTEEEKQFPVATGSNLYCAGFVQTAPVSMANKIIGAENEQEQYVYATGNNLYISSGASSGIKVGDRFSVIRPRGRVNTRWTSKRGLGFYVQEVGSVEVVKVKNDVSVVRIKSTCDNILLGDLLQPLQPRTSPDFHDRPGLDTFRDPTGKASGRIFMARDGQEMLGREQIVYIDLGQDNNVQVGDYLTVYRPLGKGNLDIKDTDVESVEARSRGYESPKYQGGEFSIQAGRKGGETATGKAQDTRDAKKNRPQGLRKVVGEIVILNVKEKTATAVITRTAQEIHTGDMVEVQ